MQARSLAVPAAALLIMMLTSCSPASHATSTSTPSTAAGPATSTPTPTATLTDVGPHYVKIRADDSKPFGSYYFFTTTDDEKGAYSRDIVLQVDDDGTYHPTSTADVEGTKAKHKERYRITVTNNTHLLLDVSTFQVSATDKSADAGTIYDGEVGKAPHTPLRPGRAVHWEVAFGDDARDQTVSVDPTIPDTSGQADVRDLGAGIWSK